MPNAIKPSTTPLLYEHTRGLYNNPKTEVKPEILYTHTKFFLRELGLMIELREGNTVVNWLVKYQRRENFLHIERLIKKYQRLEAKAETKLEVYYKAK